MTEVVRVQRLARPVEDRKGELDLPLLSVSATKGVVPRSTLTSDEPRAEDLTNYRVCRAGDLVINRMSAYQGALGQARQDGIVSPDYLVLRPNNRFNVAYGEYLMKTPWFVSQMASRVRGIGSAELGTVRTPRINWSDLGQIEVPLPDAVQQRRIAEFLDRETAQIDELIAKQEQLISTLAERRERYLLSEVAPLAGHTTGTEWFGKVPNDWRSTRLKYVSSVASGGTPSTQVEAYWSETEDGTPWVAISDMSGTDAVGSTAKRLTIDGLSQYPGAPGRPGTILFAMYASVGAVSRLAVSATWNQAILGLTPRKDVDGEFLFYVLKAIRPHLVHYFRSNTQDNMNAQQVAGLPVLMPPLDEQRRISARVKSQLDDYRALSERANAVIATLRERRQALISAAVTGQIDVGGAS